jgi:hypothetical protein
MYVGGRVCKCSLRKVSYEGFERASLPLLGSQILAKGGKQVSLAAGGAMLLFQDFTSTLN